MKTLKGVIAASVYADYQTPLDESNLYIEPWYFILSSGLYAIEFEDALAPRAVAPRVHVREPYKNLETIEDAMTVGMLAPSVSRQTSVRHLDYDIGPEVLSVGMLAPSVSRRGMPEYGMEPETLTVSALAPTVTRKQHPAYGMETETLEVAMLAPTIKRTTV